MGAKYSYLRYALTCGMFVFLVAFVSSCSNDNPTGTAGDPSGQADVDPNGEPSFFLGYSEIDGMPGGRLDVWAHNLEVDSDENIVSFDVVLSNRSERSIYPPVMFFITKIIPENVWVLNSDIVYIREGPPGFDFSDDLGDDNKLDPGEQSDPVNMQFGMEELTSFSIGFRINVGTPPSDELVSGVVFHDRNRNGMRDVDEPGMPGVKLTLVNEMEDDSRMAPEILRVAVTDQRGRYGFEDVHAGIYEIKAFGPEHWYPTTPNPMIITLLDGDSGPIPLEGVNFGFAPFDPPPIEPIFGPIPVGPGSLYGEKFDGVFIIHEFDPVPEYVLAVIAPEILTAAGVIQRIDLAKVWINDELVFDFTCGPNEDVCYPSMRVRIPPRFLREGINGIRIHVEGSEHAVLIFTIVRPHDNTTGD